MNFPTFGSALLILQFCSPGLSQTGPSNRRFDVASVKRHEGPGRIGITTSGLRLNAEAEGVWSLIMYAFNLKSYQISLTGQQREALGDMFYDVAAKADGDAPPTTDEFRRMMQSLLAERFQLKLHHEDREMRVFTLLVDKNGPKFHESQGEGESQMKASSRLVRRWTFTRLGQFADSLADAMQAPVQDQTGLTGKYDLALDLTPYLPAEGERPDIAAMMVTATPFGESSPCINNLTISQNARICRAFLVAVLAMISIGVQNYLFSASAASLAYKLRSLCLRAILRQDSKSVSNMITHSYLNFFS